MYGIIVRDHDEEEYVRSGMRTPPPRVVTGPGMETLEAAERWRGEMLYYDTHDYVGDIVQIISTDEEGREIARAKTIQDQVKAQLKSASLAPKEADVNNITDMDEEMIEDYHSNNPGRRREQTRKSMENFRRRSSLENS